ncbi:APC family permease [Brachybacterium squillarum]|uniref:APC family permease n=1 Tax=Brachybacterium squillarum TaxID=661979 RepID=UPI0029C9CE45|nr:APC family permease [Brachybacterium squillarum]
MGLAAMIGAGVFVSLGAAADLAGPAVLAALLLAAVVALANATSTAQLAARYPTSGGSYVYGREQLGHGWGFLAGWCFVIGKTASCAAMALVVAAYLVPEEAWRRPVAAGVVLVLTAVNLVGITRTAALARVLVAVAVTALLLTAVRLAVGVLAGPASGADGTADAGGAAEGDAVATGAATATGFAAAVPGPLADVPDGSLGVVLAVLQAAAILFFAFAGYARVATLGEEVVAPRRTIPRAILLALGIVLALYVLLAVLLVLVGPAPGGTGWGAAPFVTALDAVGAGGAWTLVVTVGATAAAAGSLLALVAGVSRTMLSMAREGDLPRPLAAVSARFGVPWRAEATVGAVVVALVLLVPSALTAVAASSFGVLLYYAVANAAALTQRGGDRMFPRALQVVGLAGCALLVAALPRPTLLAGLGVVVTGILVRLLVRSRTD